MRLFATKAFRRFIRRERIATTTLIALARRLESGPSDADLGDGLVKQRLARQGAGKSGGYRIILAFRQRHRIVFLFGFAKSAMANLSAQDVKAFRALASVLLTMSDDDLSRAVENGTLHEIVDEV